MATKKAWRPTENLPGQLDHKELTTSLTPRPQSPPNEDIGYRAGKPVGTAPPPLPIKLRTTRASGGNHKKV